MDIILLPAVFALPLSHAAFRTPATVAPRKVSVTRFHTHLRAARSTVQKKVCGQGERANAQTPPSDLSDSETRVLQLACLALQETELLWNAVAPPSFSESFAARRAANGCRDERSNATRCYLDMGQRWIGADSPVSTFLVCLPGFSLGMRTRFGFVLMFQRNREDVLR